MFDFTYEVTNGANFIMPMSGVSITARRFIPLAIGMVLMAAAICAGYPMLTGKRRRKSKK